MAGELSSKLRSPRDADRCHPQLIMLSGAQQDLMGINLLNLVLNKLIQSFSDTREEGEELGDKCVHA